MNICILENLFGYLTFDESLSKLEALGIKKLEIGAGGYPGKSHCDPKVLLGDSEKLKEFTDTIKRHGMEIAALACHGNPVHPNKDKAKGYDEDFKNAILLAEVLGVDTIVGFSGCPGDSESSVRPNWVTCSWPPDYSETLKWQWEEVLIPYWKETVAFAASHGVNKIALEMHPGFCVYNPSTLLRLREAVGDVIGANFDPSHLIWQGMDPVAAIRELKGSIYHVHAKDTKVDVYNTAKNGVLDTRRYTNEAERSWIFRTVGYGHDAQYWRDMISSLRMVGYEGVLSIEHEDSLMSVEEGLSKAVEFLRSSVIGEEKPGSISWA